MKLGKISESIYNRSVQKLLPKKGSDVVVRSSSLDSALVDTSKAELMYASSAQFVGAPECAIKYAMAEAFNKLWADGAKPAFLSLAITLPEKMREINLKNMMNLAKKECEEVNADIMDTQVQVSAAVTEAVVTVNAFGYREEPVEKLENYADLEIVMVGFAGAVGSSIIAKEKEEELRKRFPTAFVESAISLEDYRYIDSEAAVAVGSDIKTVYNAGQGGVLAALWEFAEQLGVGLEIELRKILFRQETIEISELYGINPYELYSPGVLLFAGNDNQAVTLCSQLNELGISAKIIGQTTAGNDRILKFDDETRFLEPAKSDSLFEIMK